MSEDQDFAAYAAQLVSETSAAPVETPAVEPAAAPAEVAAPVEQEKPAEVAKIEAPKAVEPEKKEEEIDWVAAAAKAREQREAKAKAKAEATKRDQELAELKAKAAKLDAVQEKAKQSKLAAIKELGLEFDDISGEYLRELDKGGTPAEMTAEQKRIAALEEKIARTEQLIAEREKREAEQKEQAEKAEFERQYRQLETEVTSAIKEQAADLKYLGRLKQGKDVVINVLGAHAQETGEILSILDACRMVEAELAAQVKALTGEEEKPSQKPAETKTEAVEQVAIGSNMREPEPRTDQGSDENQAFQQTVLRLMKQAS